MIFRARVVRNARRYRCCDWCGKALDGPHIYLVGTDGSDFCYSRMHAECCGSRKDPKVAAAIAKVEAMEAG